MTQALTATCQRFFCSFLKQVPSCARAISKARVNTDIYVRIALLIKEHKLALLLTFVSSLLYLAGHGQQPEGE